MGAVRKGIAAAAIGVGSFSLAMGGGAASAETCVPDEVDIADHIDEEGEVDLQGYLEAVAAANAACEGEGGKALPATGSSTSVLLIGGAALLAAGTGAVALSRRGQASAT